MDSLSNIWREWRGFILFVALMLVVRSAVADWNQVPSGSMKTNILEGDRVIVNKVAYDLRVPFTFMRLESWADPKRGEIITFDNPKDERLFIKRVIGLPGDVVELRQNHLFVNGVAATYVPLRADEIAKLPIPNAECYEFFHETMSGLTRVIMLDPQDSQSFSRTPRYCVQHSQESYHTFPATTVPAGNYLVLGDNRDDSGDFRAIGPVERWRILGRGHTVAFSFDSENYYLPRLDRLFSPLD